LDVGEHKKFIRPLVGQERLLGQEKSGRVRILHATEEFIRMTLGNGELLGHLDFSQETSRWSSNKVDESDNQFDGVVFLEETFWMKTSVSVDF
jgi:hypothetical protein